MDHKRASQLSQNSERRRGKLHAAAAMQKVADNMIAVTESCRQQFREQYTSPTRPDTPTPPFLHSRASSSSSVNSTKELIAASPATAPSPKPEASSVPPADNLMPRPLRLSRRIRNGSVGSEEAQTPIPSVPELPGSTALIRASRHALPEDVARALNLSSPTLPARLQTPTTPIERSAPVLIRYGIGRPPSPIYELPASSSSDRGLTEPSGQQGDYFSPLGFEYTAIRPDSDTDTTPPSTSSTGTTVSKEIRRKPVPLPSTSMNTGGTTASTKRLVVVTVCVAHALAAAGLSQAMLPADIIGKSLTSNASKHLHWYPAAYALGAGVFSIPAARVATIFGHKKVFVCGQFWLAVWSLLAGLSIYIRDENSAPAYFCFCRAMQGTASAMLVPVGHVILRRSYPPGTKDDIVLACYGASAPLGFLFGALMAGLFSGSTTWPWIFYLTTIISIALAVLSIMVIPPEDTNSAGMGMGSLWIRLDALGITLSISGLTLFNIGWNQVPIASWASPYTYFLMIIGAILFAAFLYLDVKAPYPLIPARTLTATASLILGLIAVSWATFGVWTWYFVLFLERLREWSALLSGAALIPLAISGVAACFTTSYVLEDRSRARWLMFAAAAMLFIGCIFLATAPAEQTYWLNTFFSTICVALGIVTASPAAVVLLGDSTVTMDLGEGMPASLTFAVAMYAMSTALGMAGAVERCAQGKKGVDDLPGYRGAQYFGLSLTSLGLIVASVLVVISYIRRSRRDLELGAK